MFRLFKKLHQILPYRDMSIMNIIHGRDSLFLRKLHVPVLESIETLVLIIIGRFNNFYFYYLNRTLSLTGNRGNHHGRRSVGLNNSDAFQTWTARRNARYDKNPKSDRCLFQRDR